jgi:hypothetical protein
VTTVRLPFSAEQFLDVFRKYNEAVGPMPVLLWLLGTAVALAALTASGRARLAIGWGMAFLWAWSGVAYHLLFFRAINPIAAAFAALFVLQAALLLRSGLSALPAFRVRRGVQGYLGGAIILYALVVYPVLGYVLGHRYPAAPTFGVPCPVDLLTLGILAWNADALPWRLLVIPVLWAIVGSTAAVQLGIIEDFGLPVAAAAVLALVVSRRRRAFGTEAVAAAA